MEYVRTATETSRILRLSGRSTDHIVVAIGLKIRDVWDTAFVLGNVEQQLRALPMELALGVPARKAIIDAEGATSEARAQQGC